MRGGAEFRGASARWPGRTGDQAQEHERGDGHGRGAVRTWVDGLGTLPVDVGAQEDGVRAWTGSVL